MERSPRSWAYSHSRHLGDLLFGYSCAFLARFGESDGDRLFRRTGAVCALADVFNRLFDEFAGLRRGRFALPFILASPFDSTSMYQMKQ